MAADRIRARSTRAADTPTLRIVVVTMDFWAQVQSYVMSQQYESLLKKANFKAN